MNTTYRTLKELVDKATDPKRKWKVVERQSIVQQTPYFSVMLGLSECDISYFTLVLAGSQADKH